MIVTAESKKIIGDLLLEGKSTKEIMDISGCSYSVVYRLANKDIVKARDREYYKKAKASKPVKAIVPTKYVDTGKVMPPTNPCKTIIDVTDFALAEKLLSENKKVKPPVCPLSKRPSSYNSNGYVWDGKKLVPDQPVSNSGMLKRQPLFHRVVGGAL